MIALYTSAYAKLNLYLDVIGKREDGYHNIESVMQAVTLRDDMEILIGTKQPWLIDSDWEDVPTNEDNLCWKAAERFFAATGEDPDGLTVHILKRIPMGAGLGGGSSDAAALLRALDVHYGRPLSLDALCRLGAEIGSDVPFCLLGGTAIAEEKGQILFPVLHGPQLYYVICKPEENLDPLTAQERGNQIATQWARAMEEGKSGTVRDFVAVGDVQIKVIGGESPILDSQVPVRQILEQLISKTGLPPFLLGFSWSTTERMSAQQADLLTSELWALRRTVQPVLERICRTYLALEGMEPEVEIEWDEISLQDISEQAQAELYRAQAAKTLQEMSKGGS